VAEIWEKVPDSLWREIEPLIPVPERRYRYPGRLRFSERACLEGILTVLRWGIPWRQLPRQPGRPSGKTCWRRLDEWQRAGVWPLLLERLQQRLTARNQIAWQTVLLDATIVDAKRGAAKSGKTPQIAAAQAARST
jgi:transposase